MNPKVSVIVSAYNHKSTIAQTIKSILDQETEYTYEVVVHDDNSTDGTQAILKEITSDNLKLILSPENKYSQGIQPIKMALPYCTGEYIAMCEGDDFWNNKNKLQIQISEMETHPSIDISFHSAIALFPNGLFKTICKHQPKKTTFSVDDVIKGGGGFMPTPSIVMRKSALDKLPDWFDKAPVGDFYFQIFCSIQNGALYLPDDFSTYRFFSESSWTKNSFKHQKSKLKHLFERHNETLLHITEDFPTYQPSLDWARANEAFNIANLALAGDDTSLFKEMIIKSWSIQKNIHKKQSLFYRARFMSKMLSIFKRTSMRLKLNEL